MVIVIVMLFSFAFLLWLSRCGVEVYMYAWLQKIQ